MKIKIKHLAIILSLLMLPELFFSSCLKEGDDTIVLPTPIGKIPTTFIAQNIQDSLRAHDMDIFEGYYPPVVEGLYLSAPMVLHYASDEYVNSFYDLYMRFSNQIPRGLITYAESQNITTAGKSLEANIIGQDSNFTMFCSQEISRDSASIRLWTCKTATVISGTITPAGIKNCKYTFIMLSKEADTEYHASQLADVDTYRIYFDGDSLATTQTMVL